MMKAEAISNYIKMYPQLYTWLYFNVVMEAPNEAALLTDSDNVLNEYIDGSKDREYLFSVALMKSYDTGTSDINMQAMKEVNNFIDWVKSNNDTGIYPDFGENCDVESVEVLTDVPELATDSEQNIARYLIYMRIPYTERRI